jgi:hypothetical protein
LKTPTTKPWLKPELIALIRNQPEETVLSICKGAGEAVSFLFKNDGCHSDNDCTTQCSDLAAS